VPGVPVGVRHAPLKRRGMHESGNAAMSTSCRMESLVATPVLFVHVSVHTSMHSKTVQWLEYLLD